MAASVKNIKRKPNTKNSKLNLTDRLFKFAWPWRHYEDFSYRPRHRVAVRFHPPTHVGIAIKATCHSTNTHNTGSNSQHEALPALIINVALNHYFDGVTFTDYTTADGLPGNAVALLGIDLTGTVWMTSANVLSSFDGTTWTHYSGADLPAQEPNWGTVDAQGNIWVIFDQLDVAFGVFDGTDWTTFGISDGLTSNGVRQIVVHPAGHSAYLLYSDTEYSSVSMTQLYFFEMLPEKVHLPLISFR